MVRVLRRRSSAPSFFRRSSRGSTISFSSSSVLVPGSTDGPAPCSDVSLDSDDRMSNQTMHEAKSLGVWEMAEVRFTNFASLSTESRDEPIESPEFTCIGHQWTIDIFPGGDVDSVDGRASLWICNMTNESITADYFISIRNSSGKEIVNAGSKGFEFGPSADADSCYSAHPDISKRSKLLSALVDGALVIEIRMKSLNTASVPSKKSFCIENPLRKNVVKMFMDKESSDVIFEVRGENNKKKKGSGKKAKSSPVLFHSHRSILQNGAPMLYELSKSGNKGGISINDVEPDIFRHMLYYVYGGKVEEEYLKENAKEIMDASDKYGVVHLKLEAEQQYVQSATTNVDNVVEKLLYADSKNCALLKEAVMDFFVENGEEVARKVSFENVSSHLVKDLMTAMFDKDKKKEGVSCDANNYCTMRVVSLRKQLHEKGLDIDGSKEAMIARLIENSSAF